MRRGYIQPARQTALRLSRQQRADLEDAISPANLTRPLVAQIEDALHGYQCRAVDMPATKRTVTSWLARQQCADEITQKLLAVLPLVAGEDGDDRLIRHLHERRAEWKAFREMAPPFEKHRPADGFIGWTCFSIVTALDRAGVPLDVGRNTAAVETLRLVLEWADVLAGRSPRPRKNLYDFARSVVEGYRRSPK